MRACSSRYQARAATRRRLRHDDGGTTARSWCADTVRLQLDQDNLLSPGGTGLNRSYLAAIETEVAAAEQHHLVVVLNDNTEFGPPAVSRAQKGPTPATEVFWKDLAAVYGHDPQVIFDLFNEPRAYAPGMPPAQMWQLWDDGGVFRGVSYPFGMAGLARYVRSTLGARNLFWIEGPDLASTLAGRLRLPAGRRRRARGQRGVAGRAGSRSPVRERDLSSRPGSGGRTASPPDGQPGPDSQPASRPFRAGAANGAIGCDI